MMSLVFFIYFCGFSIADDSAVDPQQSIAQQQSNRVIEAEQIGLSSELDDAAKRAGVPIEKVSDDDGWVWARVTGGAIFDFPFGDVGGFIGAEIFDGIAEIGVEAGVMPFIAVMYGGGAYIKVAPVHVGIGKRFYLSVHRRRDFIVDEPTVKHLDYLSGNLGYQHPLKRGSKQMWFLEGGVVRITEVPRDGSQTKDTFFPSFAGGLRF
jgi:hypothetical protein